jgi:hypothetical protein
VKSYLYNLDGLKKPISTKIYLLYTKKSLIFGTQNLHF